MFVTKPPFVFDTSEWSVGAYQAERSPTATKPLSASGGELVDAPTWATVALRYRCGHKASRIYLSGHCRHQRQQKENPTHRSCRCWAMCCWAGAWCCSRRARVSWPPRKVGKPRRLAPARLGSSTINSMGEEYAKCSKPCPRKAAQCFVLTQEQIELFDSARWPRRPYCSDDFGIRPAT